ncbi:MAG: DUF547 domain-containing protein [Alphaproteobacteria bacterium]|nr:DUF547 domain-containing protein [Alphaproteobacteria bacterium]
MMIPSRRLLLFALGMALSGCAVSADPSVLSRYRPGSAEKLDHRAWQLFLDRNTVVGADGVTRVNYAEVPAADREMLTEYLRALQAVRLDRLDRAEQLAFWLNLHNAAVVRLVLDHLIVSSPDDIDLGGPFADGPWQADILAVMGQRVSLASIRRSALTPLFHDPRWHYGLSDATLGAPSLPRLAFDGTTIDRALEDAAIAFVNHPRAIRIEGDGLVLSAFWRRYMDDFGGGLAGVLAHIGLYADRDVRVALQPGKPVRWVDDRRLNETRRR